MKRWRNIKKAWENLGFEVKLTGVYAENFNDVLSKGDWDVMGVDYAINSVDAFAYLAPFATHYSGNVVSTSLEDAVFTPHYTGFESDEYDALIDSVVYNSNRKERAKLLHQAEEMLVSLCPATALFQYTRSYVISSKLDNLEFAGRYGYYDFSDLRLESYIDVNSRETAESIDAAERAASLEESRGISIGD